VAFHCPTMGVPRLGHGDGLQPNSISENWNFILERDNVKTRGGHREEGGREDKEGGGLTLSVSDIHLAEPDGPCPR
jgi:hypothetical protein